MPLLGIIASQGRVAPNSYESIATITVGASPVASIQFTSIPATYKHLQLRWYAVGSLDQSIEINSALQPDKSHILDSDGATVLSTTGNQLFLNYYTNLSATNPSVSILDFLDYTDTNKNRVLRHITAQDRNGAGGEVVVGSKLFLTTSAISSIKIAATINQYSSFALYGIKGV
jgi:hypothetical protein